MISILGWGSFKVRGDYRKPNCIVYIIDTAGQGGFSGCGKREAHFGKARTPGNSGTVQSAGKILGETPKPPESRARCPCHQ